MINQVADLQDPQDLTPGGDPRHVNAGRYGSVPTLTARFETRARGPQ
jgi:hypothetical protein